jgi:hypothetical protein
MRIQILSYRNEVFAETIKCELINEDNEKEVAVFKKVNEFYYRIFDDGSFAIELNPKNSLDALFQYAKAEAILTQTSS